MINVDGRYLRALIENLKQLRIELTESTTFPELLYAETFLKVNEHYRGFPVQVNTMEVFRTRAIEYSTDFENVKQLGPPPSKNCKLQRCNFDNQSIFYASNSLDTSLLEVDFRYKPCAITSVLKLKNNCNLNLISIGELDFFRRHNRTLMHAEGLVDKIERLRKEESPYSWLAINYVDSYLADLFSLENTNNHIYEITSRLANSFFSTGQIDGIVYPSIRHKGGINYAFQPEVFSNKFILQECYATNQINHLGYGLFEYTEHAKSFNLNADGNINWTRDPRYPARSTIPLSAEWG